MNCQELQPEIFDRSWKEKSLRFNFQTRHHGLRISIKFLVYLYGNWEVKITSTSWISCLFSNECCIGSINAVIGLFILERKI